ncbi:RNA polymerase beta' subunit [Dorcoceras hygrometricum]|uniref:RNA polymerase beta' subunit n=1 Tax=Dorcoceras hygrometricum TaxID=472368 RepID=A0A2Z7AWQ2_9LAMI|nr:RNA polymerase beta' subunit [Dorcoceras hygrometricum]
MASSLISSSHHIDFDSVFGFDDVELVQMFESLITMFSEKWRGGQHHQGIFGFDDVELVQMFESLITMVLKVFLGCPAIFYEAALAVFFTNSSVRNGVVVSTIRGTVIEISEEVFATTFELPTEGLTDLSEVPKNLVFDARSLFSESTDSLLFGILKEMVTPGSRQAKGYAIQICVLLKNIPGLELGESRAFHIPRVLTEKMVHMYVVINEKVGTEEVADAPRVKKTPMKKAVAKETSSEAVTGMQKPVIENEQAVTEPTVATVVNEGPFTSDDVDDIIQQVLIETAQLETTDEGDAVHEPDVSGAHVEDQPAISTAERPWFDLPYEDIIAQLNDRPVVTPSDTDEEMEPVVDEQSADEAMSLEDILMSIPVEVSLSSAGVSIQEREKDLIPPSNSDISIEIPIIGIFHRNSILSYFDDPQYRRKSSGKEILVEKDPVKGNPVTEQIVLTLADIDCLVKLREKVIDDVAKFFYSFSLKRLSNLKIDESYFAKEELVLTWAEAESTGVALNRKQYILLKYREMLLRKFLEARRINFTPGDGSSAVDLKILDRLSDIHSFVLEELKKETQAHSLTWKKTCCSKIFEGRPRDRGAVIARTNTNTPSRCWIRTMILVDGVWVVEPCADQVLDRMGKITDLHLLHLNEFKKSILAHNVTVIADFMDVKKAVRDLNAKVDAVSTRLDDDKKDIEATKEAISHQLLDFQAQAQASHNIVTVQLSELVNYINRGGNDKKGEGSSRGSQPPPDDQNRLQVVVVILIEALWKDL